MDDELIFDEAQLIGEEVCEPCPCCCADFIWENALGDRWCGECGWSNDKDLQAFIGLLAVSDIKDDVAEVVNNE